MNRRTVLAALFTPLLAAPLLGALPAGARQMTAHDFSLTSIDDQPMPMSGYRGKAVLLVNTASFCGYTHQYSGLQKLWEHYRDKGLVVLAVPSNDFGRQEPGSATEIKDFCETNFDIDFPLAEKQVVKGPDAHPLYRWIAGELGPAKAPKWNFHKYLIDPEGRLAGDWPSNVAPESPEIAKAVEAVLPN
ncbi:MAG: glutathione peroxidase [Pseudomonadota bacterium]|nr:glutathione peroxidase [Pseudomonadota bacterium]